VKGHSDVRVEVAAPSGAVGEEVGAGRYFRVLVLLAELVDRVGP
jgi:hypothetical protein